MSVTPDEPIRPAAWWFGVGAGLIVVGIIAAVVIFAVAFQDTFDEFTEIEDAIDDFQRVPAPGEGDVTITDPGRYTVYVEGSIDVDQTITPPEMTIESTEPDSQPVTLTPVAGEFTYDFNGPAVRSVFHFEAEEAGTFHVEVDDAPPGVTGVAVG